MPGRGPAPSQNRRRRNAPARGEWQPTPGIGWQHGPIPDPPDELHPYSVATWQTWMQSWFASHWTPEDLPGLTITIGLWDLCEDYRRNPMTVRVNGKGEDVPVQKPSPFGELRQMMDNYGITPKGQQDRRWVAPKPDETAEAEPEKGAPNPYAGLRVVKGA